MSEYEKYQQIKREARWTGLALFVLIGFWIFAGFGLADLPGEVLGMPVWAVTSSVGVWFFAILLVKIPILKNEIKSSKYLPNPTIPALYLFYIAGKAAESSQR